MNDETIVIHLPWPPKELSPNWRGHWAQKSRAAKRYRYQCRILALSAMSHAQIVKIGQWKRIDLSLEFYPKDRRKRDDDNLIAAFKPGRDGLSDAMCMDDANFVTTARLMEFAPGNKMTVIATITRKECLT
jgi:crossover junction endodeoxyribonuclease RusA